jgi:hypothetical protein
VLTLYLKFYMADDPEITGWGSLMYHYLYVPELTR